ARGRRRRAWRRRSLGGIGAARTRRPAPGALGTTRRHAGGRRRYARDWGDPVRVVIADDAVLLREGLARVLGENGYEVVAQVGDADALRTAVAELHPDIAVVDVRMPPTFTDEGTQAAIELRAEYPELGILVLSQ